MSDATGTSAYYPLFDRFPKLRRIPRVALARLPTPVERVQGIGEIALWIKRDDVSAPTLGGNKVRALEFLLAGVRPGDEVTTVGASGSTHALATAHFARALGARATVIRWPQTMNPTAAAVRDRIDRVTGCRLRALTPLDGYIRGLLRRVRPRTRWVPAGGTSPLGMLGHVNAALELATQVERGEMPCPARVVVPLGSGGTAAGLALGFAIAPLSTEVTGVRVVPRVVANGLRLRHLSRRCARLIERVTGEPVALAHRSEVRIVHEAYGGGYGRETHEGVAAAARLRAVHGVLADATYAAKALSFALADHSRAVQLFWLTFDARWMSDAGSAS